MSKIDLIKLILLGATVNNLFMMWVLFASAQDSIKMKWRFHKAKRTYRSPWFTPQVIMWLLTVFGAIFGCVGIVLVFVVGVVH